MRTYSVDISGKMLEDIAKYSKKNGIAYTDTICRALAILNIADSAKDEGNSLSIVKIKNDDVLLIDEIEGI